VLSVSKLQLEAADIVCSKIFMTSYNKMGKPVFGTGASKLFDGFAIVLDGVDKEGSDPTCKIMLASGKILRLKEERLSIVTRSKNSLTH